MAAASRSSEPPAPDERRPFPDGRPTAMVFSPALALSVSIEAAGAEVHFHAGGQGFWIARLMAELDVCVTLVAPLGGEPGVALPALVRSAGVGLRPTAMAPPNAVSVHDRRAGQAPLADVGPRSLTRHELDDLYDASLVEGFEADVSVLAGPGEPAAVSPAFYGRLVADLQANGRRVMADMSGEHLRCALRAGLAVLKISADQLRCDGHLRDGASLDDVVTSARMLRDEGADTVIVTLAEGGAVLAASDGEFLIDAPTVTVVEARGAGDSLTAGVAAVLAAGGSVHEGTRVGAAAGVLNVTRQGLGSGVAREIRDLASRLELHPIAKGGHHAGTRHQR